MPFREAAQAWAAAVQGPPGERRVPAAHVQAALDQLALGQLKPAYLGVGIMFLGLAVANVLFLPMPAGSILALVVGLSTVPIFAGYARFRARPPQPRHAHALMGMLGLMVLANVLAALWLLPQPARTSHLMLLLIGGGLLLVSTRWLLALVVSTFASWATLVAFAPPSPDWAIFGFALFCASVLAVLLHVVRVGSLRRLEALRILDGWRGNAPVAFFAIDADARFVVVEGSRLALLDIRPQDLVGKSVYEVYADDPVVLDSTRRVLAGEPVTTTSTVNGRTFETLCSPIRDSGGRVQGGVGLTTDVTDRVALE
ncbi:MAG TPA: PAS domain-containing protein, partial [Candidatus Thermoplasmatota archaeon]|nr:PAS domain-containing protein [Candidatus Thermoplasmatota archaeon]